LPQGMRQAQIVGMKEGKQLEKGGTPNEEGMRKIFPVYQIA